MNWLKNTLKKIHFEKSSSLAECWEFIGLLKVFLQMLLGNMSLCYNIFFLCVDCHLDIVACQICYCCCFCCWCFYFRFCFDYFSVTLMLFSDSSSLSSTNSYPGRMDSLLSPPFTAIPCTSSPILHAHSFNDLDFVQGHHRRGSSGDKNKIQISAELKRELAHRMSQRRGVLKLFKVYIFKINFEWFSQDLSHLKY